MYNSIKQLTEVMVLRGVPGVVNLAALVSVGEWLGSTNYGLFSTVVATSVALASLFFGSITFSLVATHANFAARGESLVLEENVVSAVLLIAVTLLLPAVALAALGIIDSSWVAPALVLGVYSTVQEIHRARLRFLIFSAAACVQAFTLFALFWLLVRPGGDVANALNAFAISYGLGALMSLACLGLSSVCVPNLAILRQPFVIGFPVAQSTLVADGLVLGFRYLILAFGALPLLGIFSFCVDVAQRFVGVIINAATFAFVPRAFLANSKGDKRDFNFIILRGLKLSIWISAALIVAVVAADRINLVPALESEIFDVWAFVILSLAVIVNRAGKMVFNPLAMRSGRTGIILYSYLISTPLALMMAAAALFLKLDYAVFGAYLLGFILWSIGCFFMLRKHKSN